MKAMVVEMTERQLCGLCLVEHHVCDSVDVAMGGHGNRRYRKIVLDGGIDEDQSLGPAAYQQARILFHQLGLMPMMRGEVEVALLNQLIADAAQHLGVIALAQLWHENADGVGPPVAQGTGKQAGLIVEFLRSGLDAIACGLRNRAARHIVEHHGDGRWT
jgi:hypothetical protein